MAVLFIMDPGADLATDCAALLAEVANDSRVVVPLAELAPSLRLTREAAWALAGEAEAAGMVARWPDAPGGRGIVLAARTATALGLLVSFDGSIWLRPGDSDPAGFRVRQGFGASETGFIVGYDDRIDDDAIPALDAMAAAEERERQRAEARGRYSVVMATLDGKSGRRKKVHLEDCLAIDRLAAAQRLLGVRDELADDAAEQDRRRNVDPSMVHFEGTGPTWPIPANGSGTCPACGNRRFNFRTYCLWCDRSGADHFIRPIPAVDLAAIAEGERTRRADEKAERVRRKAKRARAAARASKEPSATLPTPPAPKPEPKPKPERIEYPELTVDQIMASCPPPDDSLVAPQRSRKVKASKPPKAKTKTPTSKGWDRAFGQLAALRGGKV